MRLSFGYDGVVDITQGVRVYAGSTIIMQLFGLIPFRWHSATISLELSHEVLHIVNDSAFYVFFSHPIFQKLPIHQKKPSPSKNIIVILLDALSADALGSYNIIQKQYTPNITRFFNNGIRFTNAFSQSEWTLPSVYSFFTSRHPIDHGMLELQVDCPNMKPEESGVLPRRMRELGYLTFAYSTVKVFHPAFFSHIGFDRFFYRRPADQTNRTSQEICDQVIMQLEGNRRGKNFIFLHYLDTHEPWLHPNELEESLLSNIRITDPLSEEGCYIQGYGDTKAEPILDNDGIVILNQRRNARLLCIDNTLQRLFDYLEKSRQIQESVVVLFSDHGPLYNSQKQPLLCHSRVAVPLLLYHSEMPSQRCDDLVVSNIDLAHILLEFAADVHNNNSEYGVPLLGIRKRTHVISESFFSDKYKAAVRDHEYVYHFECQFDRQTRKLRGREKNKAVLFKRINEDRCVDVSVYHPEKVGVMRSLLFMHWQRYSLV